MRRQIKILLLSLWGALAFLLGYVRELGEHKIIPTFSWLQRVLGVAMILIDWGWFLPAYGVAKMLGIQRATYEMEILIFPKNALGWILPIIVWFAILNILAVIWVVIRKRVPTTASTLRSCRGGKNDVEA